MKPGKRVYMRLPLDAKGLLKKRFRARCKCNFRVVKIRCEPTFKNSVHIGKPKIFAEKKKQEKTVALYLSRKMFSLSGGSAIPTPFSPKYLFPAARKPISTARRERERELKINSIKMCGERTCHFGFSTVTRASAQNRPFSNRS